LGFDRDKWIERCIKLNRKDNDPPYRDEQRAWYDTIRDFCSSIIGIPVVRLLPEESVWCELNPLSEKDLKWFKDFIHKKLVHGKKAVPKTSLGIGIGLVFPELDVHSIDYYLPLIEKHHKKLNLLVLPEGFETIKTNERVAPERIGGLHEVKRLSEKYAKIYDDFGISIILGFQIDYQNTAVNGSGNDQYCLCLDPNHETKVYHKHSSSRFNAFFDDNWSVKANFLEAQVKGMNIGISICHDMYISLVPRVLKKKGANLWVNISYQNVRPHIWESVLQTRAVENSFISICTLHRNSNKSNAQKEPYAFSDRGKIKLIDLETSAHIESIPDSKRAGNIYYFNTSEFQINPKKTLLQGSLPAKAKKMILSLTSEGHIVIRGNERKYRIQWVDCKEFVYRPERLWEICLEKKNSVVLFVVSFKDHSEWKKYQNDIYRIIKGRIIEFSTFFLFADKAYKNIFFAAYRSSNYKDARIFYPKSFPIEIDERFLKGMQSIYKISLSDPRNKSGRRYFNRLHQLIEYL